MGSNLAISTETFVDDDQSWLGSAHGTEAGESITLDASKFVGTWADGRIPSGVMVAKITGTGLYAPYTDAATHGAGTDAMAGPLFTAAQVIRGGTTSNVTASVLRHCQVIEANLPTSHGLTSAGKTDAAGRIDFV